MPHQTNDSMRECIDQCQRCQEICLQLISHCLELGGRHSEPSHISMLIACAEICHTSARFMLLGSKHHVRTCEACAEVCEACAEDCERFREDEMMRRCADVCRHCAASCREMASTEAR